MTRINTTIANGQRAAAKVAVGVAAYKTAKSAVKQGADAACHVINFTDMDYAQYRGAQRIAKSLVLAVPGARLKATEGEDSGRTTGWVTLRIPNTLFIQAKVMPEEVQFRALRVIDLAVVKALVEAETARIKEDEQDFDFEEMDYVPEVNIRRWKASEEGWVYGKSRKGRSFSSVIMPDSLRADIEADLKRFTDSKARLNKLELPWRRGLLLSGPPGTGKTSLAVALASTMGFSLASLSLTEIKGDGELRTAVAALPARTVLLIEDIDAYSVSHDRDHNSVRDGGLSLSGLLNALDGAETQDGLITVLTTNHIEKLDPALVRSGRIDRTFHLGYIEAEGVAHMFEWFYEQPVPREVPESVGLAGVSPSDVVEVLKQHLDDPAAGWDALMEKFADSLRTLEVAA